MDTGGGVALGIEEVVKSITSLLSLDKNQRQGVRTRSIKKIKEEGTFVTLFNPDHLLCDVLTGGSNSTDSEKDVVMKKITSQDLKMENRKRKRERKLMQGRRMDRKLSNL